MARDSIEYVVFKNGYEVGRTRAVSEIQAINNVRFSTIGILGMSQEYDSSAYKAIASIVLEFQKYYERESASPEFEQMRLPL